MPERLLLIDGNSLVHRAFHALPPLTNNAGELTNAAYGFTSMLLLAYRDLRPTYAAAAFDTSAPTFRRTEYELYKATRKRTPDGLPHQFARVYDLLQAMDIPIFRCDGFEADDVLGALAHQASERGVEAIIVTGDMDAAQLVGPHVKLLVPVQGVSKTRLYDVDAVRERYGLEPSQIADFKALRGDVSDNIPGIPGVGDKTASKLLAEHGSVEDLFAHLADLPDKTRQTLEPYAQQAVVAKKLARIVCDVPVSLDQALRPPHPDRDRLLQLFHELDFRSLIDRLDALEPNGTQAGPAPPPAPAAKQPTGQLDMFGAPTERKDASEAVVADLAALQALIAKLGADGQTVVHVVTSGDGPMRAELVGFVLGSRAVPPVYVPVGHSAGSLDWQGVSTVIGPLMADPSVRKIAHNAKEQVLALARRGLQVQGMSFDTMIAAYLLQSNQRAQDLRDLVWSRLQVELQPLSALTGTGRKALPIQEVEPARVAEQAVAAAEFVSRLEPIMAAELKTNELEGLFHDVELPLVHVLARMERAGVRVDVDYLQGVSRRLYDQIQRLEQEIYRHCGHEFNVNSTQQLSTVLFKELQLQSKKKTRMGHISTGAEVLEELRGIHPVVELLLEYRQLQKLKSTYVDALPALVNPETHRVHTSFNQTVATTGRLSSSDPNLQNIPIRTDLGRQVRRAFIAGNEDEVLLSADYSQIELRILAHITRDPTLLEAFERGDDIHAATAAEVMGIPIESVNGDQRRLAKVVNFGVLYGMSGFGLASRTELPQEEAVAFIDRYFTRFGTIKQYQEGVIRDAERLGYATTLLGRRRHIPELRSHVRAVREAGVRQAINLPIQGSAADIVKIAMLRVQEAIDKRSLFARMLLQVHDELLFELPKRDLDTFIPLLCSIMEGAKELAAPLRIDVKVGPNWDEMALVSGERRVASG